MKNLIKICLPLIVIIAWPTIVIYGEGGIFNTAVPSLEIKSLPDNTMPQNAPSLYFKKDEICTTFSDWLNQRKYIFHVDKDQEKKQLREEWKQMMGLDIFYPYFKAKELTKKAEQKTSIKVMKLKGEMEINEDEVKYIFSIKF